MLGCIPQKALSRYNPILMNRIQPRRALFRERPILVVARMQKDDLKVDRIVLNNNNTPVEFLRRGDPLKMTKEEVQRYLNLLANQDEAKRGGEEMEVPGQEMTPLQNAHTHTRVHDTVSTSFSAVLWPESAPCTQKSAVCHLSLSVWTLDI